jgi:hypothetical protein
MNPTDERFEPAPVSTLDHRAGNLPAPALGPADGLRPVRERHNPVAAPGPELDYQPARLRAVGANVRNERAEANLMRRKEHVGHAVATWRKERRT